MDFINVGIPGEIDPPVRCNDTAVSGQRVPAFRSWGIHISALKLLTYNIFIHNKMQVYYTEIIYIDEY